MPRSRVSVTSVVLGATQLRAEDYFAPEVKRKKGARDEDGYVHRHVLSPQHYALMQRLFPGS